MTGTGLTLDEALAKVNFIPQFFGVCPFKLIKGRLVVCWARSLLTGTLCLTLVTFLGFRTAAFAQGWPGPETGSQWKIDYMKDAVNSFTSAVTLYTSVLGVGQMARALESIRWSGINGAVYTTRISLNFLFMVLILVLMGVDMVVYSERPLSYLKFAWGFYLSCLINVASVDVFVGYISIMKDAFSEMQRWILDPHKPKLEAAICSYDRVTTAAEHLNEAFGIQLLLIVGANFLLSTTNAFLIVSENDNLTRALFVLWCGASAAYPLRIVYAIDHLLQQRNEFNNSLNTLLVRGHVFTGTTESAKVKLHVAMKKELEFTARGFFSLDYGLINSMLGAVTTYLVILMQFNQ